MMCLSIYRSKDLQHRCRDGSWLPRRLLLHFLQRLFTSNVGVRPLLPWCFLYLWQILVSFGVEAPGYQRDVWWLCCERDCFTSLSSPWIFIHSGFKEGDLELLGRRPNHVQAGVHRRLWSLVATCDTPGDFKVSPGRSSDEFIARLRSLEDFAKTSPAFALDCYGEGPEDFEVVASRLPKKADDGRDPDNPHGLGPYRPLDVSRLKLTGRGGWNIADHLHDELWLPYVEPSILSHGLDVSDAPGPKLFSSFQGGKLQARKALVGTGLVVSESWWALSRVTLQSL